MTRPKARRQAIEVARISAENLTRHHRIMASFTDEQLRYLVELEEDSNFPPMLFVMEELKKRGTDPVLDEEELNGPGEQP